MTPFGDRGYRARKPLVFVGVCVGLGAVVGALAVLFVDPHHPGGRVSTWRLRDGTRVRFFQRNHSSPGKDTIKVLEVSRPGKPPQEYAFAHSRGGYKWVELRANAGQSVVWVVDTGYQRVGGSLEMATGRFTDEGGSHPPGVGLSSGQVLAQE